MRSFFRIDPVDRDPREHLVPANQVCEPWGGGRSGPCDKCHGIGETDHRCLSCIVAGRAEDCPACHGRVRWRATCPVCNGTGEIDTTRRRGVSVFPRPEGLLRYMLDRHDDFSDDKLVELAGVLSDDEDFDADEGALLIIPARVIGTGPIDDALLDRVRSAAIV